MGLQWLPLHALSRGGLKERVKLKNFACSFNGTHLFVCAASASKKMFLCFLVPSITGQGVGDGGETASSDRQVFNPSIAILSNGSQGRVDYDHKATKQQNNKNRNRKSKQKPKLKPKATDRRGGCLGQPAALKLEKDIMNINILYLGSVMVIDVFATDVYKKRKKKKKNRCDQS